jgi:hypothetical protein
MPLLACVIVTTQKEPVDRSIASRKTIHILVARLLLLFTINATHRLHPIIAK